MPQPPAIAAFTQTPRTGIYLPSDNNLKYSDQMWVDNFTSIDNSIGASDAGMGWWDDFIGGNGFTGAKVKSEWTTALTSTGSLALQSLRNGWLLLATGATSSSQSAIDWGGFTSLNPQANLVFGWSMFNNSGLSSNGVAKIGIADTTSFTNAIFATFAHATPAWALVTSSNGTANTVTTGQALTTTQGTALACRIEVSSSTPITVTMYINNVLVATSTTDIPTALLQPVILINNSTATNNQLFMDYFYIRGDR